MKSNFFIHLYRRRHDNMSLFMKARTGLDTENQTHRILKMFSTMLEHIKIRKYNNITKYLKMK